MPVLLIFSSHIMQRTMMNRKKRLYASALKVLKLHQWPGNIRELKNVIIFAAYHATGDTISDTDIIISESSPAPDNSLKLKDPDKSLSPNWKIS